jgi:hypothetical protein
LISMFIKIDLFVRLSIQLKIFFGPARFYDLNLFSKLSGMN